MGNFISTFRNRIGPVSGFGKRKREDLNDSSDPEEYSYFDYKRDTVFPRRKKVATSAMYIYRTFFLEGAASDVTIKMGNKRWNLHRLYLQQSEYFNSMFSGYWVEGAKKEIEIGQVDENITEQAMNLALGSMYDAEVKLHPKQVVQVLAAATFLQLDGLIHTCKTIMLDSITPQVVLQYYDAAAKYDLQDVSNVCFKWLLVNLTTTMAQTDILCKIPPELMCSLVHHPNLFVINCELTLYHLIKLWLYIRLYPGKATSKLGKQESANYFKNREGKLAFLESDDADDMIKDIFSSVHVMDMVLNSSDTNELLQDRVFSERQVLQASRIALQHIMRVDQHHDTGVEMMSEEMFNKKCMRFGRHLDDTTSVSWRWIGFKFGMDLHFSYTGSILSIKWCNTLGKHIVNNQRTRTILYRLLLVSDDREHGYPVYPVKSVTLTQNREVLLVRIKKGMAFPCAISFNVVLVSPL